MGRGFGAALLRSAPQRPVCWWNDPPVSLCRALRAWDLLRIEGVRGPNRDHNPRIPRAAPAVAIAHGIARMGALPNANPPCQCPMAAGRHPPAALQAGGHFR